MLQYQTTYKNIKEWDKLLKSIICGYYTSLPAQRINMRSELDSDFRGVYIQSLLKGNNRSMALCTPAVNAALSLRVLHLKLRALDLPVFHFLKPACGLHLFLPSRQCSV